jgi:hypothetical protein
MATEDSGYYAADEATRRLARKRQLARLLEEQSMKFSLVNPHARASWTNVAAPLAEALVGRLKGEEADAEGKKQEAEARQAQIDWWNAGKPEPDLPVRPDMNLPGDLRALAGAPEATTPPPEPAPSAPPSALAAQMLQEQAGPAAMPEVKAPLDYAPDIANPARNPLAQLLAGNQGASSLGEQMLADQANAPTVGALKPPAPDGGPELPPLVPKFGGQGEGAPPLVPTPVDATRINIGGVSPQQAKIDEDIVKADMAKRGLDPNNVVRGPAPPEPSPTLAGPIVPGALPPLVPQPPEAAIAPPPQQGPPLLPNGQIDMAPQGLQLPAQKGRRGLDAYEMVDRAMAMPPGRQREEFVAAALKNALTEPDRRQAKIELHEARLDRIAQQRDAALQRSQDATLTREQRAEAARQALEQKKLHDQQMLEYAKLIHGGGGEGKAPSGFRWSKEKPGTQEFVPGGPADPEVINAKKNSIQIAGGRESVFTNRVMQAASQAAKDLANIVKVPVEDQTTGILGGRHQGTGLLDATKEVLAQKMTPQEGQTYSVMATGLQRALAAVETSGLAQGLQEFSKQIDVVAKEGDTNLTKLHKLAQVRQIIEAGMEVILANERVPEGQKELVRKTLDGVRASVPFTHSDLIELTAKQALDPSVTMKDVIDKSIPAFNTEAEARAAGMKSGMRVKIGGVVGTLMD